MRSVLAVLILSGWAATACSRGPAPLAVAAMEGDATRVKALLAGGADPDRPDDSGLGPLHQAARTPHVEAVRALLEGGAQVDLPDGRNGWTALEHAVHVGQEAIALALLQAGAEPDRPLVMAAGQGNARLVRALLAHGATASPAALWAAAGGGALTDLTDGPPFGTCSPETVAALLEADPALRLSDGIETRLVSWLARPRCEALLSELQAGG